MAVRLERHRLVHLADPRFGDAAAGTTLSFQHGSCLGRSGRERLAARDWVVYQQSPPADLEPTALVKYLARYVSGVAISDKRLVSCERGQVTFTVKNRNEHGRLEERTISVTDFLSRFLQHVLPSGFTRVRYYGILSTGNASLRERCRELLLATAPTADTSVAVPSVTPSEPVSTESSTSLPAATQGQRSLSRYAKQDFGKEASAPASLATSHC